MYFKCFAYGTDREMILSFIIWWIQSGNFRKDILQGEQVDKGVSIRDIDHTIRVIENGKFELIIEKGAIFSDGPPRKLCDGEMYLNKRRFFIGKTGFEISAEIVKKWLEKMDHYNPWEMDGKKASAAARSFNVIGTVFEIETYEKKEWKLRIFAYPAGFPP